MDKKQLQAKIRELASVGLSNMSKSDCEEAVLHAKNIWRLENNLPVSEQAEVAASDLELSDILKAAVNAPSGPQTLQSTLSNPYDSVAQDHFPVATVRQGDFANVHRDRARALFGLGNKRLNDGGFKSLNEVLTVISSNKYDARLYNSMNETTPSDGGFWAPELWALYLIDGVFEH